MSPWNQVTPFTYRDGMTFLEILEDLKCYVHDVLVPELNAALSAMGDRMDGVEDKYRQDLADYIATVEARFAELAETYAKIAVDEYLADPSTIDNAVAGKINETTSAVRGALNGIYATLADHAALRGDFDTFKTTVNTALSAMETALGARIDTVKAVQDTGRLSPSNMTRYYLEPRTMGALGDGVADDTAILQAALDLVASGSAFRKTGHGVLMLTPGAVYRVTGELVVSRNTRIIGNGATIRRDHAGYLLMNGVRGSSYPGYTGHGNITIENVVLDHNGSSQPGTGSTICFAHADGITLDRVTVLDATSHAYECNSSRNVRVRNCHFLGYTATTPNDYVEAIQLDVATQSGFPPFGAYDYTGTSNVHIENCVFGPSSKNDAHPRGVGAHGSIVDRPTTDVVVSGCFFDRVPNVAIRPYNWNQVVIKDNYSTAARGFVLAYTPSVGSGTTQNTMNSLGVQTGASVATTGLRVVGNTSIGAQGVMLIGSASGRLREVTIVGNSFTGEGGTSVDECIRGYFFDGVVISDNQLTGFAIGVGFYADGADYRLTVQGNQFRYCGGHAVYVSGCEGVTVAANQSYNCGYNRAAGSHYRIAGDSTRIMVSNNILTRTGDEYTGEYGIYVASTTGQLSVSGNVASGAGTTPVSVATTAQNQSVTGNVV